MSTFPSPLHVLPARAEQPPAIKLSLPWIRHRVEPSFLFGIRRSRECPGPREHGRVYWLLRKAGVGRVVLSREDGDGHGGQQFRQELVQ